MSMFLFVRSLKTYKKGCSEKVRSNVDQNLKFFKELIIFKRTIMIRSFPHAMGIECSMTDSFSGFSTYSDKGMNNYIAKVRSGY